MDCRFLQSKLRTILAEDSHVHGPDALSSTDRVRLCSNLVTEEKLKLGNIKRHNPHLGVQGAAETIVLLLELIVVVLARSRSLSLAFLLLLRGIGGVSNPPAYWPPICYGAFGGLRKLFEYRMFQLFLDIFG